MTATDSDISYLSGYIAGFLVAAARNTPEDKEFDEDRWKELYGTNIVYNSYPYYPTEEARENDERGWNFMDWDDETETKFLEEGGELPDDRPGKVVFEEGTAVIGGEDDLMMFSLDDSDLSLIERLSERRLETIREVQGYPTT